MFDQVLLMKKESDAENNTVIDEFDQQAYQAAHFNTVIFKN